MTVSEPDRGQQWLVLLNRTVLSALDAADYCESLGMEIPKAKGILTFKIIGCRCHSELYEKPRVGLGGRSWNWAGVSCQMLLRDWSKTLLKVRKLSSYEKKLR